MNKLLSTLLLLIVYSVFSCNSGKTKQIPEANKNEVVNSGAKDSTSDKVFQTDWTTLTKDFNTWYSYTYYNVRLSENFIGLDTDSTPISKSTFLNKLINSNLVAFKIKISQGKSVYKLYKLNSKDESIKATIKQMATTEMVHFKMEGTEMPKYNFTDLNGKTYDNTSTKGKIVVLKCWFIHCVACVKEFPDLNNLVQENKNRNDILFISLAMDSKQDLITFLKTKEFKYAVIPETKSFMNDKMHITEYPTHLLIDRNGKIVKVVNRIEDLIPFINKEELKT
jgi:thiol-disulfide isomerase/thioredoxin